MIFSIMISNCSNLLHMRNLQEHVKKAFCYQKSDLKIFENSRPSPSNFKSFSLSLEQFFLTVGQNNFANKIPNRTHLCVNDDNCNVSLGAIRPKSEVFLSIRSVRPSFLRDSNMSKLPFILNFGILTLTISS